VPYHEQQTIEAIAKPWLAACLIFFRLIADAIERLLLVEYLYRVGDQGKKSLRNPLSHSFAITSIGRRK